MTVKEDLKNHPNWMQKVMYDAHISIMANHDLQWCMQCMGHMNLKYTVPIPESEQEDLYKELNKRFISWTGKSLGRYSDDKKWNKK